MFGYKKYTVFFEAFGKKMKTTVVADGEEKAKNIIRDKIVFHKVEIEKFDDEADEIYHNLMQIFK